jgi:hypothetical protein
MQPLAKLVTYWELVMSCSRIKTMAPGSDHYKRLQAQLEEAMDGLTDEDFPMVNAALTR